MTDVYRGRRFGGTMK